MPHNIFHDMETGPLPESYLLETFKPTFEPNKTLKDPAKVEADIAEKRKKWLEDSALHAERGKVLCLGWKAQDDDEVTIIDGDDERDLLLEWIDAINAHNRGTFAGFNSLGFDWPFARRRCILNGISFPFYDRNDKWKPWTIKTYDAMLDWQSGDRREYISLNTLSRALGIGSKPDGVSANFSEVYRTDKPRAIAHLTNDVLLTERVCERLRS